MSTVYLALGSNVGNRYEYISHAIALLSEKIHNIQHSSVYETKPWGMLEQNTFFNMVIQAETTISPFELLDFIHQIEDTLIRVKTHVNGPRTIDIDILLYDEEQIITPTLTIPHPRLHERDFVVVPLSELHPTIRPRADLEKYIIKKYIMTKIVGILNLSPESFGSDYYTDNTTILKQTESMIAAGAHIIDIGAQSTKPGAVQLNEDEELRRLTGVIKNIKQKFGTTQLSIDTTRLSSMKLAIDEGVDMINDISGGRFAPEIIPLIAGTNTKFIITHSQGNFSDIHQKYEYTNIIEDIKKYFTQKITTYTELGLSPTQIILDPGIGFSKQAKENFEIINRLSELRELGYPLYIGLSRKKFIGSALNIENPVDRDLGTTILHTLCIQKGVSYIRTHNVLYAKQAIDLVSHSS